MYSFLFMYASVICMSATLFIVLLPLLARMVKEMFSLSENKERLKKG